MEPIPTLSTPPLPDDLGRALADDPAAREAWDALSAQQKKDWLQYLAEGRAPARRAIRIVNLLMSITDA